MAEVELGNSARSMVLDRGERRASSQQRSISRATRGQDRNQAADPPQPLTLQDLIERIRSGDAEAVDLFLAEYGDAVEREARLALIDARLRRVVSESDIYQSVFGRFFAELSTGNYEFRCASDVLGLLKKMVRARVVDLVRYWSADRRKMHRNIEIGTCPAPAHANTPGRIAAAKELLNKVLGRLDERQRLVLELRLEKMPWEEIAKRLEAPTGDALRKQHERVLDRVAQDLDLDHFSTPL